MSTIGTVVAAVSPIPSVNAAPQLAADPWDSPYFGAPVYFVYPAFAAQAVDALGHVRGLAPIPSPDSATSTAWDPWDAPYFGAPVYLKYRDMDAAALDVACGRQAQQAANCDVSPPPPESNALEVAAAPIDESRDGSAGAPATTSGPHLAEHSVPVRKRRGWFARLFGER